MGWNQLVGGFRESVAAPRPHEHLVAIGALNEKTRRQLAWSASEVRRGETLGVGFYSGTPNAKTIVTLAHGVCTICGAEILRVEPSNIEQRLPECRIGNQGRVLVRA